MIRPRSAQRIRIQPGFKNQIRIPPKQMYVLNIVECVNERYNYTSKKKLFSHRRPWKLIEPNRTVHTLLAPEHAFYIRW